MVGDHLDFAYTLSGPIAAGVYDISVSGNGGQCTGNTLVVELDDISDAGSVLTLDVESLAASDAGFIGSLNVNKTLGLVDAGCGDTLRMDISVTGTPDGGCMLPFVLPQLTLP